MSEIDENKFFKEMQEKLSFFDINFCVKQSEQFFEYMKLLIEWNEKINLTAIIDPEEVILKHFIDSITILKDVKNDDNLVDVGTGAGFPRNTVKHYESYIKNYSC